MPLGRDHLGWEREERPPTTASRCLRRHRLCSRHDQAAGARDPLGRVGVRWQLPVGGGHVRGGRPGLGRACERRPSGARAAAAPEGLARLVQLPGGRKIYLECRGRGGPTVVLVSGYGDGATTWSVLDPGVRGPAVLAGVSRSTRVCAYDRPNTLLRPEGLSRSDPVAQPRTAADAVAELHALLRAARLPGPYVLVGHSLGGMFVRLYASTYPRQVAGLVLVDATYELLRDLLTPEQWAGFAGSLLEPPVDLDPRWS